MLLTEERRIETPKPPRYGWRCYHCDYVARTFVEAQEHFGLDELELPACVQQVTESQKAILESRAEWKRRALDAEFHLENDHRESHFCEHDLYFTFKVKRLTDVKNQMDDLKAEIESLKMRVRWVPKWVRKIFMPKEYYDLD